MEIHRQTRLRSNRPSQTGSSSAVEQIDSVAYQGCSALIEAATDNVQMVQPCTCPDFCSQHSLVQALSISQTSQAAFLWLAQTLANLFVADFCAIVTQAVEQPASQQIYCFPECHTFLSSPQNLLSLLNHPLLTTQLGTQPLAITDLQAAPIETNPPSQSRTKRKAKLVDGSENNGASYRSVLAIRTEFQGHINGVILLMRTQPYEWKAPDVKRLQVLAPQVAVTIAQFQLEQQVQRQARYQVLLDQMAEAVRDAWDLDRVMQFAVEQTAKMLQVSRGMVLLFKYSHPLRRNRSAERIPAAKVSVGVEWCNPAASALLGNSTAGCSEPQPVFWAAECQLCCQIFSQTAGPIALATVDLLRTESNCENWAVAPVFHLDQLPAVVLMPLENQGTLIGCLVLQHQQQRIWLPEELALVKLVAAQLSTAIVQTRTLQQVQSLVEERTAQLQRSLEVQAKLYEKTRQQVNQLRRLNEEREEFLSTVSHELLTPLTSMRLAIRMLRQANDLPAERRAKYLDILEEQCTQETNLINDLLALRKLESSQEPMQLQKLDIRYLIRDVANSIEENWVDKNLKLTLDLPARPVTIYTDPDSLTRILTELLTNAQKYSAADTEIALTVQHEIEQSNSQVVLALCNRGAGIPPEELPHIFEKFRRGQGATQQAIQGTGLGLALVKGLVEHLSGTIVASSQMLESGPIWETCFTVKLPQCPDGYVYTIP